MRAASSALQAGARERAWMIRTPRFLAIDASCERIGDQGDRYNTDGNADQFAAGRLEVRLKTTAGASNQSESPARLIASAISSVVLLDPASVKLRSYLQNRQVVTFLQCSPFARYPPVSAKPVFDNGFA